MPIVRHPSLATLAVCAALASALGTVAYAHDVSAIYGRAEHRATPRGWRLGVAEHYTRFATLKDDGGEIDNPGERLHSSSTQLLLGYDVSPRFGVQLNFPIVTHRFRRREGGVLTRGSETGPGDLTLLGMFRPVSVTEADRILTLTLLGGLKLPSGSAARLREERGGTHHGDEGEDEHARASAESLGEDGDADHAGGAGEESGVHGHDLALGSGSVDGVIGAQLFAGWRRLFFTTTVQYAIRGEGHVDYRYANDVIWNGGPGIFALGTERATLGLQAVVAGEHKGKDTIDGRVLADTAITAVYLGPRLAFTWGDALGADLTAGLPVLQDNSARQLVPDFRLRGGLTWHF